MILVLSTCTLIDTGPENLEISPESTVDPVENSENT